MQEKLAAIERMWFSDLNGRKDHSSNPFSPKAAAKEKWFDIERDELRRSGHTSDVYLTICLPLGLKSPT